MALASTGDQAAFEALRTGLLAESNDRNWAKAISRTLARYFSGGLAEWAAEEAEAGRQTPAVLWALARGGCGGAGPWLEFIAREATPAVRTAALRILARQKGAALIPELRRALHEGKPSKVAHEAFGQMLRLGDDAVPVAEEMLSSDHWTERKAAYALLRRWGRLTPEQAQAGSRDPHVAVRHAARWHPAAVAASAWHPKWRRRIGPS
jgi:hypothetical protein